MRATRITYDPDGDILYVTFGQPVASTGYQLSDQILLRVDPTTQRATGLTIRNYSHHATASREIPLPGIKDHSDVKPLLLSILGSAPVSQFLSVTERDSGISAMLLSPSLQEAVAGQLLAVRQAADYGESGISAKIARRQVRRASEFVNVTQEVMSHE